MRPELSITAAEMIEMHDRLLERSGGRSGLRVQGCLEQCIGNAKLAEQYRGSDDGTLGLCFIGSLMFYVNKNQCFVDGNKRTSLTVAVKLLADLGASLDISQDELAQYCTRIAADTTMKPDDVVRWIGEHVVAY